jgi:hypothetical protein
MFVKKRMNLKTALVVLSIAVSYFVPHTSLAGEVENLETLLTERLRELNKARIGNTFGIPSSTTLLRGTGFYSLSVAELPGGGNSQTPFDASAAVGYGLLLKGYPSLDIYLGITSVNPKGADGGFGFGEDGNISVKSTLIDQKNWGLAVGVNNLLSWGEAKKTATNIYVAASYAQKFQGVSVTGSAGYGDHQSRLGNAGAFVGLGAQFTNQPYSVGVSYNVDRWLLGVSSSVTLYQQKFGVSWGFDDALDDLGARRLILSVSKGF